MRSLSWPLFLVQFFGGLFVLSPFFRPDDAPSGNLAAAGSIVALKVYGAILTGIGASGIYGLVKERPRATAYAAMACFFLFTYFTLLRIIINGVENIGWTTFFLNGCMAGVIYLRLRWEEK